MHKITNRALCASLTLLLSLPLLPACQNGDEDKVLKINEVTHSVFYAPFYLADALGYFKEEGI